MSQYSKGMNTMLGLFDKKIFDFDLECEGYTVNIPKHSGIGNSMYKRTALDNPLSNELEYIFNSEDVKSWLILDPRLLPYNNEGLSFADIEDDFENSIPVYDGLYIFNTTNIQKYIGFIGGDWTTIVGLRTSFEFSKEITIQHEYEAGNVVFYLESIDAAFWKVCKLNSPDILRHP